MVSKARILVGAVALCGGSVLAACGPDVIDTEAEYGDRGMQKIVSNKITGSVQEWSVQVSATHAVEGNVTFAITNFGSIKHEFLVVKTDFADGEIPLGPDDRFSEDGEGLEVVDEIPEWDVNSTEMLNLDLKAGNYQLLCNIAGHYSAGMHTAFTVESGDGPPGTNPADPGSDEMVVSNDVTGSVSEWAVNVDADGAEAGEVNFTMANEGTIQHEFLVVKTDFADGEIPIDEATNRFSEEMAGIEVVDEIPEWTPGETKSLQLDLDPGNYQLLCNIEGHYGNGMHTGFTVLPKKDPVISNAVSGAVHEWGVNVDADGAKAGDVTFTIANEGTIQHEFLVVKTEFADGEIPLDEATNRFSEDMAGVEVVDEIPEWAAGETQSLTLTLEPGNYQLLCNIEGHYANGMHRRFTVVK